MSIAIDIVLLPPKKIRDFCIRLSSSLDGRLKLREAEQVPHISLAMTCVEERHLPALIRDVDNASKKFLPQVLLIAGGTSSQIDEHGILNSISIKRNGSLQELHEAMMGIVSAFPFTNPEPYSLNPCASKKVEVLSLKWVSDFKETSAFEKFKPHITLGFGEANFQEVSRRYFTVRELCILKLGPYCSCSYLDV